MKLLTMAAALLVATAARAQSPADHEKHHPDAKSAPASTQPATSKSPSGMGGAGMGSQSGMHGMMGGGMMNMMGGKMPMMEMMQVMGMMRQSDSDAGMGTVDRIEGRIAFLRAELKINEPQVFAWDAFADALRANAKSLGDVRSLIMAGTQASLINRLSLQEQWLAARLEGTRAIKSALITLVATLSDEQKKLADELLAPHIGMMTMMHAVQMQSGMKPGR